MSEDRWYLQIGAWLGGIAGLITFVGAWWYCAATYGFLLGFGLGWLPAVILAFIVGLAVMFLWGVAVLGALAAWFLTAQQASTERADRRTAEREEAKRNAPVVQNAIIIPGPNHTPGSRAVEDGDFMVDGNRHFSRQGGRWVQMPPASEAAPR